MHRFILASSSPRRRELLSRVGLDIEVIPSGAEEILDQELPPEILVQELALLKAAWVAAKQRSGCIVLGADTVVAIDGVVLGKPQDAEEARRMLERLSGNTHEVYTGICVIDTTDSKSVTAYERTEVKFKELTELEIEAYIESGEPLDKAGAYGIQEKGALLIEGICGDYFNVVGLPLNRLYSLLNDEFNIQLL